MLPTHGPHLKKQGLEAPMHGLGKWVKMGSVSDRPSVLAQKPLFLASWAAGWPCGAFMSSLKPIMVETMKCCKYLLTCRGWAPQEGHLGLYIITPWSSIPQKWHQTSAGLHTLRCHCIHAVLQYSQLPFPC